MLDPAVVARTRHLLGDGQSQREINRRLPISRGSVHRIATGKRPDYPVRRLPRCPDCGARLKSIRHGCLACRAASSDSVPARLRRLAAHLEPLGLDLQPADHERYLQVARRGRRSA